MLKGMEEMWGQPVLLGEGAFSEVYRVTHRATEELAVCKISSRIEMAEREAGLMERINHPLFPVYKGQQLVQGKHYLFMEYICGCELRQYVEKRGGLSRERAVEIALELAKGLNYLHEQPEPVIFRDIKPENVLIQQDGRVRLVDVGCAYVTGSREESMAGTRGYAAPEQLMAGGRIGRESDVYALGKLLCYMLKGRARDSRGLYGLLQKAVATDPMKRIPDMRTFMLQLELYAGKRHRWEVFWYKIRMMKNNPEFYYKKNICKDL